MKRIATFALIALAAIGCGKPKEETPVFRLSPSEYTSWSVFMVAGKLDLINPEAGKLGSLEKKHGVDIELKVADYDTCITLYAGGQVDAVCITNIDALNPALGRSSTAILPNSTSDGADIVITSGLTLDDLKAHQTETFMLTKSVSHLVFHEALKAKGFDPKDFKVSHLDPGAAATAIQNPSGKVKSICVWNPFALTCLKNKNTTSVLSSKELPGWVIDSVVVGDDSLAKPGGDAFAKCVCEAYYEVKKRIDDPATEKETLAILGEVGIGDVSETLSYEDMKTCVTQTKLFSAKEGIELFKSDAFKTTMGKIVESCKEIEILEPDKVPTLGYNGDGQLKFVTKYMEAVAK